MNFYRNKGRTSAVLILHVFYCRLIFWWELGLRLIIRHACLEGGLVVSIIPIMAGVPGPDLLASVEKGKDLCSVDTVVYVYLQ